MTTCSESLSMPLTARQRSILDFIRDHIASKGYGPTIREIGLAFHIKSTNGVNDHLLALDRKGYIRHAKGKSRTISLVPQVSL